MKTNSLRKALSPLLVVASVEVKALARRGAPPSLQLVTVKAPVVVEVEVVVAPRRGAPPSRQLVTVEAVALVAKKVAPCHQSGEVEAVAREARRGAPPSHQLVEVKAVPPVFVPRINRRLTTTYSSFYGLQNWHHAP